MQGTAHKRFQRVLVYGVILLVLVSALGLLFGASTYSPREILQGSEATRIVVELRLPRVLMAMLVGGALALVGAIYQALFRNPLASPFSLGVSSGAALGASVAMMTGAPTTLSAIVSAMMSIGAILVLSRRRFVRTGDAILLVGIIFSFFCSSLLTLVEYLGDYTQIVRLSRWMMGGIPVPEFSDLLSGGALVVLLGWWVFINRQRLDLMWFGEEMASAKGVDIERVYRSAFLVTSLVVGWIVAQCGVIGFVGIIVPAGVRLMVGLRHGAVAPLSFLFGALLVVSCDLLGRTVAAPFEIPVGIFTAVVGGPFFMALLLSGGSRRV